MTRSRRHPSAVWLSVMILASACKTPGVDATKLSAQDGMSASSSSAVTSLAAFGYDVKPDLLQALGARIGCKHAARWVTHPKSGSVQTSVRRVVASTTVYDTIADEFFNHDAASKECERRQAAKVTDKNAGIKALIAAAQARWPNEVLTVVAHGDFGNHLEYEAALDESMAGWREITDVEETPTLDFWQFSCSNSFAPIARCAKEMADKVRERAGRNPDKPRRYLMWGYGRGGNTILEALRSDESMRERTVSVVTVGAPIGGSVAMDLVGPAMAGLAKSMAQLAGVGEAAVAQFPGAFTQMADYYLNKETLQGKLAEMAKAGELADVERGTSELRPAARQAYLKNELAAADFSRPDGTAIPVLHLAALLDLGYLVPVPEMTLKGGQPALTTKRFSYGHLASLGFSPLMRDYPLSDGTVALQHAVLAKEAIPKGLAPELLGIFRFDHFSNRLTPPADGRTWEVPHLAIVDAVMQSVAARLAGGQP